MHLLYLFFSDSQMIIRKLKSLPIRQRNTHPIGIDRITIFPARSSISPETNLTNKHFGPNRYAVVATEFPRQGGGAQAAVMFVKMYNLTTARRSLTLKEQSKF